MKNTVLEASDTEITDLEAEVEIERFLVDRYGLKKDTVRRNYDEVIQSMGLSGNARSDWQVLQSGVKEVEARAEKIAKVQNMGPVERRARTIAASASRLAASMGRGSTDIITKLLTTGELRKYNESEEDRRARALRRQQNLEFGREASGFFRDVKDTSGEVYGEDPGFRRTFEGKLFEGGTQLVGQMGTLGYGLIPQMYDEAVSDAEAQQGIAYEEMSPDMQARVDKTAGTYAVVGAALERIGLGIITKKLLGKNSKKALQRLLNTAESAVVEGTTEAAQGQTLDILAKVIQEDEREIWNTETLMQRLEEFALGFFLGGGARGTIESGDALYRKFLDPEKAATKADFNAIKDKSGDEVAAAVLDQTGDAEKAELAVKAHRGDEQARQDYIESHYYQEGEEVSIEQEAGLSKDEMEALQSGLENDTSALPEEFYIEQEREMDEITRLAALDEAQDWFESIQGDDQSIERNDEKAMPFVNKVNDLAIEQGWTQNEKDAYINEVLEAASANTGRDLSKMVDKLTVLGESTVDFVKGVAQYKTKLYKGATVFDLVEEEVEGYAKRYLQEGSATHQEFIEWKQSIEQETGEKTHSDTERGVIEWLSSQGQGWYLKNMQDQEALNRAPAGFLEFIQRFIEKLKAVFRDADLLRRLDEEGKLNKELRAFLDRALGFDEAYLQERFRQQDTSGQMQGDTFSVGGINDGQSGEVFLSDIEEGSAIPDRWYLHGRSSDKSFGQAGIAMATRDINVAEQYAGKDGAIYALNGSNLIDLNDPENLQSIISLIEQAYDNDELSPEADAWVSDSRDSGQPLEDALLVPDLVSDGGAWDISGFTAWLSESTGNDGYVLGDGQAVFLDSPGVESKNLSNGEGIPNDSTAPGSAGSGATWSNPHLVKLLRIDEDIDRVYNKYKTEEFPQYIKEAEGTTLDVDDRHVARIIDNHFDELNQETQLYLEFEAGAIDFEGEIADGPYRGMIDGQVHGSHITTLRNQIETLKSEEMDRDSGSTYSVGFEGDVDAEYLNAVKSGDMEQAQAMVDEAAKKAGYTYEAYHNSGRKFNVFDIGTARTSSDIQAFFFKDQFDPNREYGPISYHVYLKLENPANYRQLIDGFDPASSDDAGIKQREKLQNLGYDGFIVSKEDSQMDYVEMGVFRANQIKSADPVSFDADGNIIPLSERFDDNRSEISYSIGFEDDGIDPKEFARQRTPEEEALAQKLRELRNFDLTQKQRKKLQEEAKVLQVKAVESRKRQRLRDSATKKLAAEIDKRVAQIRKMAESRDNLEKAVQQLEDLLSKLPRGVKARFSGYGQLASRKTIPGQQRYVEQATNRIDAIVDKMRQKENRDQLLRLLGTYYTDYGPNRRKLRRRVGEKAFDELYFAASLLRTANSPAPKTIKPARADMLRNVFGGVLIEGRSGNPARLADAVKLAEDIIKGGLSEMDEWNEARQARNEGRNNRVIDTVLKGEDLKTEQQLQNDRKDRSRFKRNYDTAMAIFFHPFNGLQQMMNLLDGKKGGVMDRYFSVKANQANQKEISLNREHFERTQEDLLQIFDGSAKKQAEWFQNADERIDTGVSWVTESGKSTQHLNRLEMVDVLAQWGDPTLRNTFYAMKVAERDIDKIRKLATPYGVKLAEYLRRRYAEIGIDIQSTFKETEGFAMDLVEGYGGRVYRAGVTIDPDDTMFGFGGDGARATVKSASMKERVDSTKPIIFSDAFAKFDRHMRESNHYISHASLAKDFFATFRSRKSQVRKAIKQRHGDELLSQLDGLIDDIIRGRTARENRMYRLLNGFRANITRASLAIKPAVAIKQLTSWPAYIEEIGFREYGKAFAEFLKDPMRWMKEVYNTEYVKNRLDSSIYADIQDQIKSRDDIPGKSKIAKINDVLMLNVKLGDIGAVIFGGTPVYLHTYKKAIDAGKSEAAAKLEAEDVFTASSERAQQSSAMASRGSYLRDNSWTRSWFMYLTSPIQYQRNVNVALYNLVQAVADKNRGNKADVKEVAKQALRAVLIFHVILPQIFQAVASGFLAFTDDDEVRELFWERQLQTLLYGNFTVFPVAGQVIQGLAKIAFGNEEEIFSSSGSPMLDLIMETKDRTMKVFKDGDSEDWLRLTEDLSKLGGIPMETVVDNYEAIEDVYNNDAEHPILRLLGWSEWALGEKE